MPTWKRSSLLATTLGMSRTPPSLHELNRRADLLAARANQFLSNCLRVRSSLQRLPACDLDTVCQNIVTKTQQLCTDCSKYTQPPVIEDEESPLGLLLKERMIQAELAVWRRQLPSVSSTEPLILEEDTTAQLCEWTEELEKMLKAVREERAWLARELEEEKLLLQESRTIKAALEEKRGQMRGENGGRSSERDTCTAIERLETTLEKCSVLRESLQAFVDRHFISSFNEMSTEPKRLKKATPTGSQPSLVDVIQRLISKCLDTPQEPYISTETIWPPHLQLLLRSWVVERHPVNPTLVRITTYHQK